MKVKIEKEIEESTKEIEFPCIMESDDGFIILMLDDSNGLIVKRASQYRDLTVPSVSLNGGGWSLSQFKPFKGKIILENEGNE